jgi:hypothetical protein
LPKRLAVLVFGSLLSGAAFAADADGDGVEDDVDVCPAEDASGHDYYMDGCIDTADDFAPFIGGLGIEDDDAEGVLVLIAERVAIAVERDHMFLAALAVHAAQATARAFFRDDVITLRQMRSINDFARALLETW